MAETSPVAMLVVKDGYPHYMIANAAAQQFLGYSREELRRLAPHQLVAAGQTATVSSARRAFQKTGCWHDELHLRRKDGMVVPTEVTAMRLVAAERNVYLFRFRDISARETARDAGAA